MANRQIEQSPEEIEKFILILRDFDAHIMEDNKKLSIKLKKLGETWRDSQFNRFSMEFGKLLKNLSVFNINNEEIIPKLKQKAERGRNVHKKSIL